MKLLALYGGFALLGLVTGLQAQAPDPRNARNKEFIDAAQLKPNLEHGAVLFQTCAACHGDDGRGTADGEIPAIAGQHGSVLLKQLTDFRHDLRWDQRMQFFTDRHHLAGPQELTDVAAYVASLPRFPTSGKSIGDGSQLSKGASVYFRECEHCHGPLGEGDVQMYWPRLAGQHYVYLLRQLQDTAHDRRPGMNPAHVQMLGKLSLDEMRGVADYLSRVSPDLNSLGPR